MTRSLLLCGFVAAAGVGVPGAATAAELSVEQAVIAQARAALAECRRHGWESIGVLRFGVNAGDGPTTGPAGTLNMALARRLEMALILQTDRDRPVDVIAGASGVAERLAGADHTTAAGRAVLFRARYPVAWGDQSVTPDVFLTGTAEASDDLRALTLRVIVVRPDAAPRPLGEAVVVRNRAADLTEIGASFSLRSVPGAEAGTADGLAIAAAAAVDDNQARHPLAGDPPVRLNVRYDGRDVPIRFADGKAFVDPPRAGQAVKLVLARDGGDQTYGVVLKVNGENTLSRQRNPDLACKKWVMRPGCGEYVIDGYQTAAATAEAFRVLTPDESRREAANYGADVGTFTLTVFRDGGTPPAPPADPDSTAGQVTILQDLPDLPKKETHEQLVNTLLVTGSRGVGGDGGLVASGGAAVASQTTKRKFVPQPTPVMAATVHYYAPDR